MGGGCTFGTDSLARGSHQIFVLDGGVQDM